MAFVPSPKPVEYRVIGSDTIDDWACQGTEDICLRTGYTASMPSADGVGTNRGNQGRFGCDEHLRYSMWRKHESLADGFYGGISDTLAGFVTMLFGSV